MQLAEYAGTIDGEVGSVVPEDNVGGNYPVIQGDVVGAGGAAFHLAHPVSEDQYLRLTETLYVEQPDAVVHFLSRLGWATSTQVARVQVSSNDGGSWADVYAQPGTGNAGETGFTQREASLAEYQGRTVRVQFLYSVSGSRFPQTESGVGWYVDNITATGVKLVGFETPTNVSSGTSFSYAPSLAAGVGLQARGRLSSEHAFEWGPVTLVTPVAGGTPVNPGRLVNLSILTALSSADDVFTMGYVVGGAGTSGTKPILVRAAGPSLVPFGVGDPLENPRIELFAGATQNGVNDDWGGTAELGAAFSAVGAFSYTGSGSRDAAVLVTVNPGDNSVRVFGTGPGTVIAELYDSTPAASFTSTTPRLINVSVLKQLGSGLTTGFVIGGATSRTVLVRAIGPSLAGFGVEGALADPRLALFSDSNEIDANDNWGGDPALEAAFGQVGAFLLLNGSFDAALVTELSPGPYTAQVSGVGGSTGIVLVEVYEVP